MTNSYDELVNSNICTGSASYSDMMKCSCYECFKERQRIMENSTRKAIERRKNE